MATNRSTSAVLRAVPDDDGRRPGACPGVCHVTVVVADAVVFDADDCVDVDDDDAGGDADGGDEFDALDSRRPRLGLCSVRRPLRDRAVLATDRRLKI